VERRRRPALALAAALLRRGAACRMPRLRHRSTAASQLDMTRMRLDAVTLP
jgi:hypothetical protein